MRYTKYKLQIVNYKFFVWNVYYFMFVGVNKKKKTKTKKKNMVVEEFF